MKNELEKKKFRICGFVGIDPNTDSFKWISDELDEILNLFHQEQIKLIEEFEGEVIGEDEEEYENDSMNGEPADDVRTIYQAQVRNELKEEQRVKLEDLKKTIDS